MNLKILSFKIIPFVCLCILFYSCTNSPKNIPFPSSETEYERPKKKTLGRPDIVKCIPLTVPLGAGRPDSLLPPLITKLKEPNVVPFIDNERKLGAPKINSLASPLKIKLHDVNSIECKPKTLLLGQPEKVICKPAKTADNAINNLKFYSQDQGLVATVAQCMCYDELGNLWVGTDGGLCKFDGQEWWIYTTAQGLSSNYIFSLNIGSKGQLLVGTSGGGMNVIDLKKQEVKHFTKVQGMCSNSIKCILERKDGKFFVGTGTGLELLDIYENTLMHFGKEQGFTTGKIRSVVASTKGKYFVGTAGGGMYVFDDKKNEIEVYGAEQGLTSSFIRCIIETKEENLLIGTNENGLDYVDFRTRKVKNYGVLQGLSDDHTICMSLRNNGDLVMGTFGGGMDVLKFNLPLVFEDGNIMIENYNANKGLSSNIVVSLLEGRDKNLLIGTEGGGLNILDNTNQELFHFTTQQGLSNNFVFSVIESSRGKLVIGTDGGGFNVIDEKNKTVEHYTTAQGLSNDYLRSLFENKEGKLIVGTDGSGIDILNVGDKLKQGTITHFDATNGLCNNSVFSLHQSATGSLFIGTLGGGMDELNLEENVIKHYTVKQGLSNNNVISVSELRDGTLLIATSGGGLNLLNPKTQELKRYTTKQGIANDEVNCVFESSEKILFVGNDGGGLDIIDLKAEEITNYNTSHGLPNGQVTCIAEDSLGTIWVGTGKGLCKLVKKNSCYYVQKHFDKREGLKYMDFNNKAIKYTKSGKLWAGIGDVLTKFDPYVSFDTTHPSVYITKIDVMEQKESWNTKSRILSKLNLKDTVWSSTLDTFFVNTNTIGDSSYFEEHFINYSATEENVFHLPIDLVLPSSQNHLAFHYAGICIAANNDRIRYRYILDGLDKHWSPITEKFEADYRNIPPGNYVFKVAARNANGFWSKPTEFKFTVSPPWYRHPVAYAAYFVGFFSIMFGFNGVRTRQLKLRQQILEKTVEERTAEVVEEKKIVEEQKHLIEEKHKEITDSINYAERIQRSFIATKQLLDENLNEYFVLFKPKDVVSGDFYWAANLLDSQDADSNKKFALVTADSTGHGVPGAIMSLLNVTSLEKAIEGYSEPSDILNATRKTIIDRLKKDGSAEGGKDGMDCSFCVYDFKNKKLTVSAANNPVWIVKNSGTEALEVLEVKPDKMPVGKHDRQDVSFTQHEIDLQKGDVVYTLTDGFPDQFGGERGKKFMSKNLRELLCANAHLPMNVQKDILEKIFADWVGNMEQVDDVTLIGIRI